MLKTCLKLQIHEAYSFEFASNQALSVSHILLLYSLAKVDTKLSLREKYDNSSQR